jgi:hypothetical protein
MAACNAHQCASSTAGTHVCPLNGTPYKNVSLTTILHNIKAPWRWKPSADAYYFCDDPECTAVYFGSDNTIIDVDRLRSGTVLKGNTEDALLCHCFGISMQDAINDPALKTFVIEHTRDGACACETRNPSGRCCLKDFP